MNDSNKMALSSNVPRCIVSVYVVRMIVVTDSDSDGCLRESENPHESTEKDSSEVSLNLTVVYFYVYLRRTSDVVFVPNHRPERDL